MKVGNIVVYTAVCGDIDPPREDILCFTEQHYNEFRDPRRNSRIFKILPHLWLPEDTKWSIWVDANIFLKVSPEELVAAASYADWAVFAHNYRASLEQEVAECKRLAKGDPELFDAQLAAYENPPASAAPLAMCGIQIRKHIPIVIDHCREWWSEFCRWNARDQLSFPFVVGPFARYLPPATKGYNSPYFRLVPHRRKR
jgi:hypothetical protein